MTEATTTPTISTQNTTADGVTTAAAGGDPAAAVVVAPGEPGKTAEPGDQVTSIAGAAGGDAVKPEAGEGGDAAAEAAAAEAGKDGAGEAIEVLGAPETYELKAPEGMEFDQEAFALVEPDLRELDLSGPAAQRLVDSYATKVIPLLQKRAGEQATATIEERNVTFRKELADAARADPEIGGKNWDETIDRVATVWQTFGIAPGTGLRQTLDDSGLGNDPDLLRFLSRVGKAVGEGSFISGEGGVGGGRKSDTEVFYGDGKA